MRLKHTTSLRTKRSIFGQGFETLENRIALSAAPPMVVDVSVASADWSSAFYDHLETNSLGTGGYSIPVGSADQLAPLAWSNINQVRITFNEDVYVDAADLSISGVSQASYAFSDFDYYPEDRLAIWTLAAPLGTDRYRLDLDADGLNPITDLTGDVLDGDWTDSISTTTSGDGTAGGDFEFSFNVLPGDMLGIDLLEYNNLLSIYYREGVGVNDTYYEPKADVDGDGLIEASDWETVWNNMYASTPVGTPVGATSDAPTTSGFGVAEITDDTVDVAFSLYDAFDDAEDTDSQLTYSIKSSSDASLFDSVSIDQQTGELIVNTAAGVSGRANLVVVATDQSGLTVEATKTIDVDRTNIVPTMTVSTTDGGLGIWLIEGWVTDPDNDLDNMWVALLGVVDQRVSVAETGYFFYAVLLDPLEAGSMTAHTTDDQSISPTVYFEIGW